MYAYGLCCHVEPLSFTENMVTADPVNHSLQLHAYEVMDKDKEINELKATITELKAEINALKKA